MMFMTDYRIKGAMCKRKLNFFELEPSNMFTNLTCSAGDKYLQHTPREDQMRHDFRINELQKQLNLACFQLTKPK